MKQLLRPKQVQEILQISQATLYRWVKEGKIGSIKVGKQIRFDPEEIDRFLQDQKTSQAEEAR